MEIITNLFEDIGWGPLLTVNELYYPKMIYEFYANLHKGKVQQQGNIIYTLVTSRVGGRDISFDDRMLNTILGTLEDGFDPNLYSERRFEELFSKGEVLKRRDDRNSSNTLCKNLVGVGDHIGIRKIHCKHTFKRMIFSRNEEDMLVRGGQESDEEEEEEDDEGQDAINVDEEDSEEEPEEETFRREMRQKKRQERVEEGQSFGDMSQLMEKIASMQASMNSRIDALDGKISDIQENGDESSSCIFVCHNKKGGDCKP
ncbi:hypothetical protein M9H77_17886 [Catharanthus roseus]|uniref:Uncharacterized protein n=1 Tax=Catharanthus roseus TaxID=4058 RepID=A0ACC0B675_CATRO|nr:hypothetical protein M9H77_17886 [Catharanthus roseus]